MRSRQRFSEGEVMVLAALRSLGLIQVPDYLVDDALAAGRRVELLPRSHAPPMPISAVYPSRGLRPPRVRVVLDVLSGLGRNAQ